MGIYREKSIELVELVEYGKKVICLKHDKLDNCVELVCSDCQQKYNYKIPFNKDEIIELIDTTFCPFCGKERKIPRREVKTSIADVRTVILGDASEEYRNIDIISDFTSNCVVRSTYQVPVSIKELNSMMEIYGLTRIGNMWVDINFLDKAVISNKENHGAVLERNDIHFMEGRKFIPIGNKKKLFRDLIKNKIYLKADLSKMNVEFYEKYYKPYEETMKEKHPEVVLLKLMDDDF